MSGDEEAIHSGTQAIRAEARSRHDEVLLLRGKGNGQVYYLQGRRM